jgi:hypothetical protein
MGSDRLIALSFEKDRNASLFPEIAHFFSAHPEFVVSKAVIQKCTLRG